MRGGCLELEKQSWYHGKLSREECEQRMAEFGHGFQQSCFLVRESTSPDRKSELTLSLRTCSGRMKHFIVRRGAEWVEVDGTFKRFSSFSDMVEHYRSNSLTDDEEDMLSIPCPRKK